MFKMQKRVVLLKRVPSGGLAITQGKMSVEIERAEVTGGEGEECGEGAKAYLDRLIRLK